MMKRVLWVFLAFAATVVSVAFAEPPGSKARHRRFLDYLPVGSQVLLIYPQEHDYYRIELLTAKQVEQRLEEFPRIQKLEKELEETEKLVENQKGQDAKLEKRRSELSFALRQSQAMGRSSAVYEVIALGEDFVELRLKVSATGQVFKGDSRIVVPAARIREIRLTSETNPQPARTR
jgi:dihydroneopterin aldolase